MKQSRNEMRDNLSRGYRIFGAMGWGDMGDGHISARDPEQSDCFWMLQYGVPFTHATAADLALINFNGEVIEGNGFVNPPGIRIHRPILVSRSDVVSAAHTHSHWGTPFSAEARVPEPITQESCIFYEDCALFDDEEVHIQTDEGGERIAQYLGRNNSIILRNHGLLTTGASIATAVLRFIALERVAEAHLKARNPQPISTEAARFARSGLFNERKHQAKFEYVAKHYNVY